MKFTSKAILTTSAALMLGLTTLGASAHPGGNGPGFESGYGGGPGAGPMGMMGPGAAPGMGPGMRGGMGHGGPGFGNPISMTEGHLAWLKSELKITGAQESAWKAFADQRRQQAEAMAAWAKGLKDKAPANALERMELRSQMAKQRQEQSEKMVAVFKGLYTALSPEQKAMLDQGLADRGHGFHGGPGRGR